MRTELLTGARRQKVVVERHEVAGGLEWMVMLHTGAVEVFDTADAALKAVKRAAGRGNKSVTVTSIEWRNVPDGWTPPR